MQTCTPRASLLNPLNNKKMNREEQKQVADLITANTIFCTKEVLTSDEAAKYMGVSKSYLYKLTMRQVWSLNNGCKVTVYLLPPR